MTFIDYESLREDEDRRRLQNNNKNYEEQKFTKVKTDDTFCKNLINCKKILTMWELSNRGYKKINEVYLFEDIGQTLKASRDGRYLSATLSDSETMIIFDAKSLEK